VLTTAEMERYDRQIVIRGVGKQGQERLKKARVVIAGSGGLGSVVSIYLAAAGIGTIRLIDHDDVEISNLNRQVLYWEEDVGRRKVISASEKLRKLNPGLEIEAVDETITEDSVSRLVSGFDLIVDAMDNLPTRLLLNKTALDRNIPFFHGAVHGFEGRVMTIIPGKTACLKCVYRGVLPDEKLPVIGVTPAVVGSIQATEVIKYVVGIGRLLADRFLVYDGLAMRFAELKVARDLGCEHCGSMQTRVKKDER
jgi:molybdopterin/thiamine biosynthesis adenylyltransferase